MQVEGLIPTHKGRKGVINLDVQEIDEILQYMPNALREGWPTETLHQSTYLEWADTTCLKCQSWWYISIQKHWPSTKEQEFGQCMYIYIPGSRPGPFERTINTDQAPPPPSQSAPAKRLLDLQYLDCAGNCSKWVPISHSHYWGQETLMQACLNRQIGQSAIVDSFTMGKLHPNCRYHFHCPIFHCMW